MIEVHGLSTWIGYMEVALKHHVPLRLLLFQCSLSPPRRVLIWNWQIVNILQTSFVFSINCPRFVLP